MEMAVNLELSKNKFYKHFINETNFDNEYDQKELFRFFSISYGIITLLSVCGAAGYRFAFGILDMLGIYSTIFCIILFIIASLLLIN